MKYMNIKNLTKRKGSCTRLHASATTPPRVHEGNCRLRAASKDDLFIVRAAIMPMAETMRRNNPVMMLRIRGYGWGL